MNQELARLTEVERDSKLGKCHFHSPKNFHFVKMPFQLRLVHNAVTFGPNSKIAPKRRS